VISRYTEHPTAEVLRVLAVSRSSGALEIRGTPSGTVFLHAGEITYAQAAGLPTLPESAGPQPSSAIHSFVVETGLTLLTGPVAVTERPLFRPGRRHWTGLTCRIGVETLLREIAQRMDGFRRIGVEPDEDVQLCARPRGELAVLTRPQWALAVAISGPQTVRSLARRTGASLSTTVTMVASLVRAGVVEFAALPPAATGVVTSPVPRSLPVLPEPEPEHPPPVPVRLPRRLRGATSLPSPGPDPTPKVQSAYEDSAEGAQALALRLLEGLRRL
jgi:DNA-binding MarR family transcriptional regulator